MFRFDLYQLLLCVVVVSFCSPTEDLSILRWARNMRGNEMMFLPGQSLDDCYKECRSRPKCLSFSYRPSQNWCILNNQSMQQNPGSVEKRAGYVFSDRDDWKTEFENPCEVQQKYNEDNMEEPCSVTECSNPDPVGVSRILGNRRFVESQVLYVCNRFGSYVTSSYISTCLMNGSWSQNYSFSCDALVTLEQWVARVVSFSSQYDTNSFSARQVVGEPDVYPSYGDLKGTWAQLSTNNAEFIELEYDHAVYLEEIHIYETFHAGGVKAVKALNPDGIWETVWGPYPVQDITSSRINSITIQATTFLTKGIRLDVDCTANGEQNWVEIDAVKIVGLTDNAPVK